jgi:hypothetical protein
MIELCKCSLFYGGVDLAPHAFGDLTVTSTPISEYEEQEVSWKLFPITNGEVTFTMDSINLELLDKMTHIPVSDTLTIQYSKPIMIQARWHKKYRTNKKWLKRFGMKPDTVTVSYDAESCAYDVCDGRFDIDAHSKKYNWKPHQKRRNIKIEL